jgi:hypothetical protein
MGFVMRVIVILFSAVLSGVCSVSPSLAQSAGATPVTKASMTAEDCRHMVQYIPSDDVAYQPGVDVNGNPVAPADIPSGQGQIKIPDQITINFGIDLAGKYGVSGDGFQTATDETLFKIKYDLASGGLTVNGQPLGPQDSRAVAKACTLLLKNADGASPQ